jgi:hypothetical protein
VIFESLTPEWNASFVMDFIPKEALNAELVVDVYDHDEVTLAFVSQYIDAYSLLLEMRYIWRIKGRI